MFEIRFPVISCYKKLPYFIKIYISNEKIPINYRDKVLVLDQELRYPHSKLLTLYYQKSIN